MNHQTRLSLPMFRLWTCGRNPGGEKDAIVKPFGVWRSLVARLTGGQKVVGAEPATPTNPGRFVESCIAHWRLSDFPRVSPDRGISTLQNALHTS